MRFYSRITIYSIFVLGLAGCVNLPLSINEVKTPQVEIVPTQNYNPPTFTVPPPTTLLSTITPHPSPTVLACISSNGQMIDSEIESSVLPQPLEYKIYIPPCYEELPEHSFPVLYLIHGQTFRQDQWDRLGVDETADSMIGLGESVPFIIVLPRDRIWATPNTDKFGEGVINDLVPYIDRAYRTIPNRQFRSIGGLSRGASWAVHLGLQYWEVFGAIGAHSLPVFWSDVRNVRPWLKAIPPESMPRIYIDIATKDTQDSRESTEWFISVLIEENIQHEWYRFVGTHTEDYWQDHIRQYLQFYTKEW